MFVVSEAEGNELFAVCTCDVETVCFCVGRAEDFLLEVDYGLDSGGEGFDHFFDRVLLLEYFGACAFTFG